jgi:density-regulated protein
MAEFAAGSAEAEDETLKSCSAPLEPLVVRYCPTCSLPPEYCEYGPCFDTCLPWIVENMPEVLSDEVLARMTSKITLDENGEPVENEGGEEEGEVKKKKRGGPKLKKVAEFGGEVKVVIAKVQRQKRKYITVVAGLETVPGVLSNVGTANVVYY